MRPAKIRTLAIDGRDVGASAGETILEVSHENGIDIPTLCHLDGLSEVGACRLCLVEVEGSSRLLPACVTAVEEGMIVRTHSPRLDAYRRGIVELILSERNHVCSVCVANGNCDLQSLATRFGITHVHYRYRYPQLSVDTSHHRFGVDHNRCILCTRCVRVCDEIEGAHTWDVLGRGIDSRVITDLDEPWGTSDTCTSCGKCVAVCPTGALFEKGRPAAQKEHQRAALPYLVARRGEGR